MRQPSPGSHDALQEGCRCSPHANQFGLGTPEGSRVWPAFEIHPLCPVHDAGYSWEPPAPYTPPELPPLSVYDEAAFVEKIARKAGKPRRYAA